MSNPGKRSGPRGTVRGSGRGVPGSCRPAAGAEEPGTAARPGWELSAALGERSAAPGLYGPEPRPPATHRGFGRGALRWRRPRVTRCDPALRLCAFVCPAAPPRPAHKAALRAQRRRLRSPRLPEPRNAPQCPAPHPAPGALRGGGGGGDPPAVVAALFGSAPPTGASAAVGGDSLLLLPGLPSRSEGKLQTAARPLLFFFRFLFSCRLAAEFPAHIALSERGRAERSRHPGRGRGFAPCPWGGRRRGSS